MSTEQSNLVTAKSILSTLGSIAAAAMVARSITNDLLPHEFTDSLSSTIRSFIGKFSSDLTMVIDEFDGLESNQIYEAVELYLGSNSKSFLSATSSATGAAPHRLKVSKLATEKSIQITVDRDEEMVDLFNGVKFRWILVCSQIESKHFYNPRDMNATLRSEVRAFHLNFHKKHKSIVIDQYLPYVIEMANSLKQEIKTIKIHTVDYQNMYGNMADAWPGVNLNHPAQFETLAMDSDLKEMIMADLKRFVRRREYYRRVGKAWKRGYLLYGPPGTGKSSLIAAMANYLNFDIYDLELTGLRCNSELRRLLVATANRSILVVEDIDCSIELTNREAKGGSSSPPPPPPETRQEKQVTLSGFLNFIDGLWSSCGDERIIIFTTNHKDKLDPALLRPGRMDVHIHMSYCTPSGFKVLAQNYLGIIEHVLFEEIEKLIEEVKVTPAEVAEQLMKHDDSEPVLSGLIEFLNSKKCQSEEVKVENEDNEDQKEKIESDK